MNALKYVVYKYLETLVENSKPTPTHLDIQTPQF